MFYDKIARRLVIVLFAACFLAICSAQANQTNSSSDGISVLVRVGQEIPEQPQSFVVTIHFTPPNTNNTFSPFPKAVKFVKVVGVDTSEYSRYFMATNSFCGPVELRDASGNKIPLLHPEVNSPEAYPDSYNLRSMSYTLMGKYGRWSGPPLPLVIWGVSPELRFPLQDYFNIKNPGEYQLTVWPKIYKRISPTNDLCQRIDIPSATVTVTLETDSRKTPLMPSSN